MELSKETLAIMIGYSRMYAINQIKDVERDIELCSIEEKPAYLRLLANYQEDLNKIDAFNALFSTGMKDYTITAEKMKASQNIN